LRFRIVDKNDGPTSLTRAPVLWQRTQEILAALGIRDLWLSESGEMLEESLHFYGKAADTLPVSAPNSSYLKALYAGQNVIERLLDGHLHGIGTPVDYGREAIAYSEDAGQAVVTVRDGGGIEERIAAR